MKTLTDSAQTGEREQTANEINLDGFREAACGEESERIELLKMYADQLKLRLPQAEKALQSNDLPAVAKVLHSLTGATFTCGLQDFGMALRSVEESAKSSDATATVAAMPNVLAFGKRVDAAIASELARGA